jgi:eukaryotic-like serine/threonine-protein kinase
MSQPIYFMGAQPVSDDEEGRAFLQQRLATSMQILTIVCWVGFVAHTTLVTLLPAAATAHPMLVFGLVTGGGVVATVVWLMLRPPREVSLRMLRAIDSFLSLWAGGSFAIALHELSARIDEVYFCLVFAGFIALARALLIPSSTLRTLVLALVGVMPVFFAAVLLAVRHPERLTMATGGFVTNSFVICTFPVQLAAASSWVISGLRRRMATARRLGQYILGEQIGAGGMGVVYKAQHALLRRPTAIKLLPPEKSGAEAIRRFEREVQLTAELTDPHTVAIFDYGRSPDGTFYYAMEYLDGIDLARLVRAFGPLPPGRVVNILRQVCDALGEAHVRGLIHRDIKPANIILCERGQRSDAVKVVDFGLVQDLAHTERPSAGHGIAGTPAFLAPEAITDPASVWGAADLYALGAVGYYLLTGTHVFDGNDVNEILRQHVDIAPEPPSLRLGQPVPAALEALILRCLHKDPQQRPTAATLATALDALEDVPAWSAAAATAWWATWRANSTQKVEREIDAEAETQAL